MSRKNVVTIDDTWLSQFIGTLAYLDQPDTLYRLETDRCSKQLILTAPHITLDLNSTGFAYDDAPAPPLVQNGDFSQGFSYWAVSGMSNPATGISLPGMIGQKMLTGTISSAGSLTQSNIPTVKGMPYTAVACVVGRYDTIASLSVIEPNVGVILGSATMDTVGRGFYLVAEFIGTGFPVSLILAIATKPNTAPDTIAIADVNIFPAHQFDIVATPAPWNIGKWVNYDNQHYSQTTTLTDVEIRNGWVRQGQGSSYGSDALYLHGLKDFVLDDVGVNYSGMDTAAMQADYCSDANIVKCPIRSTATRISNRMRLFSAVLLENSYGSIKVDSCSIKGCPSPGIYAANDPSKDNRFNRLEITGNEIRQNSIYTDSYGIVLLGVNRFEVAYNQVIPTLGRGIALDNSGGLRVTSNGKVHHNYCLAHENLPLEYRGATSEPTIALRMRAGGFNNVEVVDNDCIAYTDDTLSMPGAIAGRFTFDTPASVDVLVARNRFWGQCNSAAAGKYAWGFSLSVCSSGDGVDLEDNIAESNHIPVVLGDADGWQKPVTNVQVDFRDIKGNPPLRSDFTPLLVSQGENPVTNVSVVSKHWTVPVPEVPKFGGSVPCDLIVDGTEYRNPAAVAT